MKYQRLKLAGWSKNFSTLHISFNGTGSLKSVELQYVRLVLRNYVDMILMNLTLRLKLA
jgi:hypothetical protein